MLPQWGPQCSPNNLDHCIFKKYKMKKNRCPTWTSCKIVEKNENSSNNNLDGRLVQMMDSNKMIPLEFDENGEQTFNKKSGNGPHF